MQISQDQKHWESVGGNYVAFWRSKAKQEINKKEMYFLNKYLHKTKGQSILDIGVGSGRIIENYLVNSSVKEIYGIDWAISMVNYCRNRFKDDKRVKNVMVCNISKEEISFKKSFDFISAIRVLKYNKNWGEIIGRIIDKLEKDGIFVFTIPNKYSFLRFTTPETAIYSSTKNEIERLIETHKGISLQITTFNKLPDVLYDIYDNNVYTKIILMFESLLKMLFGDIFLGREFFVAVSKK